MEVEDGRALRERGTGQGAQPPNVYAAFYATAERLGDDVAIRTADDSVAWSWNERRAKVQRIAGGLAKLGVKKGDTVAIMLNNRPEFIPCDLAAVSLGGDPVLDLPDLLAGADRSTSSRMPESRIVIVEPAFLEQLQGGRARTCPTLEHVIVVDGDGRRPHPGGAEADRPGLRSRRARRPRSARRPADADLHLGHHRAAEGRAAHPSQPDGAGRRGRRDDRPARAGRQGDLLAARRPHRRARRPLLPAGDAGPAR